MADKKPEDKKDSEKPAEKPAEQVLTPEELQKAKSAMLTGLWGDDAAKTLDDPKSKTETKPCAKEEKKADEKEKADPDAKAKTDGDGGNKDNATSAKGERVDDPGADNVPAGKKIVVKKKGGKEKEEPAAEKPQPDVEETVRRVLAEDRQNAPRPDDAGVQRGVHGAEETASLTREDRETISVLQKMEEQNPRHKGLAKRTLEFFKKDEQRQTQWEDAHPGEDYDPDAAEHKGWYDRNSPKYPEDEFEETKAKISEERLIARAREEVRKEYEPKIREIQDEKRAEKLEPIAEQRANEAVMDLLSSVPEFQAAMDDGKGNLVLSEQVEAKMIESNPALFDIANEEANRLSVTVKALEKHVAMPDHFPADPNYKVLVDGKTVRPFAEIRDVFNDLEELMVSKPRQDQIRDGKQFITSASKRERQDQIVQGTGTREQKIAALKRLDEGTWTITPKHVSGALLGLSKQVVESFSEKSKKWSSATKNGEHKNGEAAKGAEPEKKAEKTAPPPSGATASVSDNRDNTKKDTNESDKFAEKVVTAMW